jgi:hypothetical protein
MTIPATGRSRIVVSSILAFRTSALRGNERANFARVSEDHVRAVILRCWRTSEFISYLALEITSDKSSYRNQSLPEVKSSLKSRYGMFSSPLDSVNSMRLGSQTKPSH